MAVGIRIRNESSGMIQIGDGYRNHHLRQSGVLTAGDFVDSFGQIYETRCGYRNIALAGPQAPIVVLRNFNGIFGAISVGYQNNLLRIFISSRRYITQPIEYYIFDSVQRPSSSPVGLRLRDSSGEAFYDSTRYALRVIASDTITPSRPDGLVMGPYGVGYKTGVMLPNPRWSFVSPYPETAWFSIDAFRQQSNNSVVIDTLEIWNRTDSLGRPTWPPGSFNLMNNTAQLLIVDLTNIPIPYVAPGG